MVHEQHVEHMLPLAVSPCVTDLALHHPELVSVIPLPKIEMPS